MRPEGTLRLSQLLGRLFALSGVMVLLAAVAGYLSYQHLSSDRQALLNRIDPADLLVSQLLAAYLDQETAVRGYALSRQPLFLAPYESGGNLVSNYDRELTPLLPPTTPAGELLAVVRQRARVWETNFARPSVNATSAGDKQFNSPGELNQGKNLFDNLRNSITALQRQLSNERKAAEGRVSSSSDQLAAVMIASGAVILLTGGVIWIALRRQVIRPVAAVAEDARTVTSGDLEHEVRPTGPVEVVNLAHDIEAMRQRIFAEVTTSQAAQAQLATLNEELARSNEDLEQFAYVASHDLQEPLRKVASFCQLLEKRYGGQLDERGEQYIAFAVDGAKRMQVLINDLLAFSRIGRTTERFVEIGLTDCTDLALRNLAGAVEQTDAQVRVTGTLPVVMGDKTLLTGLMQNLIGNAIKFHGDAAPQVVVAARAEGDDWLVSVSDNGIGIEPRFAERIFIIFQRLHGREAYGGTGIGLAMCRKIVEFHGGRIWLDTDHAPGTRFCFTLPQIRTQEVPDVAVTPAQTG